jgi:hypothetical protein
MHKWVRKMKHGWYLMKRDNYYMTAFYDGAFYRYSETGQYLVDGDFQPVKWLCEYEGKEQGGE